MQANPVIVKELRGRMRGWRALGVLVIYLVVLSLISWLVYLATKDIGRGLSPESSQVGKILFATLVVFQTIMVSLLTPAFTAGAITSEREQKTYDLLMTTLLPARSIVLGKLGSALAYVVLLIVAIAPLESLAFMFGGVSPEEIILSQVVMLASAVLFASIGIFWSSALRSSVASNVLTYGTIIFQMLILPFLYGLIVSTMGAFTYNPNSQSITDTYAFFYTSGMVLSSHPLVAMGISDAFYANGDSLFIYTSKTILNGKTVLVVSPWLLFCIEALLVSTILVLFSIRMVRPIHYRKSRASSVQAAPSGIMDAPSKDQSGSAPVPKAVTSEPVPPPPPPVVGS